MDMLCWEHDDRPLDFGAFCFQKPMEYHTFHGSSLTRHAPSSSQTDPNAEPNVDSADGRPNWTSLPSPHSSGEPERTAMAIQHGDDLRVDVGLCRLQEAVSTSSHVWHHQYHVPLLSHTKKHKKTHNKPIDAIPGSRIGFLQVRSQTRWISARLSPKNHRSNGLHHTLQASVIH